MHCALVEPRFEPKTKISRNSVPTELSSQLPRHSGEWEALCCMTTILLGFLYMICITANRLMSNLPLNSHTISLKMPFLICCRLLLC